MILHHASSTFQLKIKEAIHVQWEKLALNHQLYHVNSKLSLEYFTLSCFLLFLYSFSISSCAYDILNSVHCRYKILLKHAFKNVELFLKVLTLKNVELFPKMITCLLLSRTTLCRKSIIVITCEKRCVCSYLLKLIYICGHSLTVNNRRYGRCYVKDLYHCVLSLKFTLIQQDRFKMPCTRVQGL